MAINIISVQHNGGFLAGIILLTQCYCIPSSRNPFKYSEEVLYLQSMTPPPSDLRLNSRMSLGTCCKM